LKWLIIKEVYVIFDLLSKYIVIIN
jgi:hypothetical protein